MKFIDLTHTFKDDMPVWPGDPKPSLKQVVFIQKDTFNDHKLETVMHIGTHIDAPLHMIEGGRMINEFPIDKFIGRGVLIDVRGKDKIDGSVLDDEIKEGSVVLLFTGMGEKYHSEEYWTYPEVMEDFVQKLVDMKVKMVGMDILGPDHDQPWSVHKILLSNEILILENLTNLDQLLGEKDFEVIALPAKLKADAAPVRVIASI